MHGRWILTLALLTLLGIVQVQLWWGRGSVPSVQQMKQELATVKAENQKAQLRNDQLRSEVRDLQEGFTIVEEKARFELGLVKDNEIFVQFSQGHTR
jgi:cell division protein FtsB